MTIDEKYLENIDNYYQRIFGISKNRYDKAFKWANFHWYTMLPKAQGKYAISIASQIIEACHIPYSAAADIANSISMSRHV